METPIFVISDDNSYLGLHPTSEDAESYLATRVADDATLQQRELHFFDRLGRRIDADRSDVATFALRGTSPTAEPEDLHRRIRDALRKIREWLESQPEVVRNRQGNEYPTAEVLDRVRALEENVGPGVPFDKLVPAMRADFMPGDDAAFPSICKVRCTCRK